MAVLYPNGKLPVPVRDGFGAGGLTQYKATKMDDGHTLVRRSFKRFALKFTLAWRFTDDQLAYFQAWVKYSLRDGVDWFEIDLNGKGMTESVKFLKEPQTSRDTTRNKWVVTAECHGMTRDAMIRPVGYIAQWPAELPDPEANQYSYSADEFITTSANPGDGKMESLVRFSTKWTEYNCEWKMSPQQLEIFRTFLSDEIAHGYSTFGVPFFNGCGRTIVRARFSSYPEWSPLGAWFQVRARLETSQAPIMSRDEYNALG